MADQNKNQSNQNKQSGQQGSQHNQGSGTGETYRTQDPNQNPNQTNRDQNLREGQRRQGESFEDETMGEGGRTSREPAHTANDRGFTDESRNVSSSDRESLDRESGIESESGLESETDIEDDDLSGRSNR